MRIAIIGCVSKKLNTPHLAKQLYVSPQFKSQSTFVDVAYDKWFIMSVKHGLLSPNQLIEPYDLTLKTNYRTHNDSLISEQQHQQLVDKTKSQIQQLLNDGYVIDFHLTQTYYKLIDVKHKKHPNTNYIKCFNSGGKTSSVYNDAINMINNGSTLDESINYINEYKLIKRNRGSEPNCWWYHPIYPPFYGKSYTFPKHYKLNVGNLFQHYFSDVVNTNHVMGWSHKLENVMRLKLVNGRWRMGSEIVMTQQRLDEIKKGAT